MSEETQSQYDSLTREYEEWSEKATLADLQRRMSNITSEIAELPAKIKAIRSRGYAYRSYLENKTKVFEKQWEEIRQRAEEKISTESSALSEAINRPKTLLTNLERQLENDRIFEKFAGQAETAIESLKEQAEAAIESIEAIFETLEGDLRETYSQLAQIEWVLDQKEEASFDFGATETVFLAAKAELMLTGKGRKDPDGILFLTNQRIVFEQKEKTGKKLGMFGGKNEQEVEWETPLSAIEKLEIENKGMFGGKDMMHFTMSEGDMLQVTVEVKGNADNKFWQKQVNRMISGDVEDERAIEPDAELIEALKNAPTACHVCSATLPKIVAGQSEIECQYCGAVIRVL